MILLAKRQRLIKWEYLLNSKKIQPSTDDKWFFISKHIDLDTDNINVEWIDSGRYGDIKRLYNLDDYTGFYDLNIKLDQEVHLYEASSIIK